MKPGSPIERFAHVWSEAEKETLRQVWCKGIHAARAALPGRTDSSMFQMRERLGIEPRRRMWTEEDVRLLRRCWGLESLHWLSRTLGRQPNRIAKKASDLGLEMGAPQGFEFVWRAAVRTGYPHKSFVRLLRWAGVKLHKPWSLHKCRSSAHRHVVDSFDVDDAVERWCKSETLKAAAKRLGTTSATLEKWLRDAGIKTRKVSDGKRSHFRMPPEDYDRAAANNATTCATTEHIEQAARRYGVSRPTMRGWLDAAGVPRGRKYERLELAVYDQAAEAWKVRYAGTETMAQAAERIGVMVQTMRRWMNHAGVPRGRSYEYRPVAVYDQAAEAWKNRVRKKVVRRPRAKTDSPGITTTPVVDAA